MKPLSDRIALGVLILGAMIIGLSPILVRLSDAGPSATGVWRLAFAAPFFAILTAMERPVLSTPSANRFAPSPLMLIAGVFFSADLACWHYAIHFTTVANATVLSNGAPIVVTAVGWLLFRERPRPIFIAGMGLAIGGAIVTALAQAPMSQHAQPGVDASNPHLGDLLSLSTALWYGGYFLVVRVLRKAYGASAIMFWSGMTGLPILVVAALLLKEPLLPATAVGWAACVGLGLVQVSGQGAIAWALGRVPTALASVVVLIQPVVAAVLGWMMFNEAITPLQGVGAAIALIGVALAELASRGPPTLPEP